MLVVPSPVSSSCARLISIMLLAGGCLTVISRRSQLPSFVITIPPIGSINLNVSRWWITENGTKFVHFEHDTRTTWDKLTEHNNRLLTHNDGEDEFVEKILQFSFVFYAFRRPMFELFLALAQLLTDAENNVWVVLRLSPEVNTRTFYYVEHSRSKCRSASSKLPAISTNIQLLWNRRNFTPEFIR